MTQLTQSVPTAQSSVLIMSDRLITLAQEADRAGYAVTAERLLHLAHDVFDDKQIGDKQTGNKRLVN